MVRYSFGTTSFSVTPKTILFLSALTGVDRVLGDVVAFLGPLFDVEALPFGEVGDGRRTVGSDLQRVGLERRPVG